MKKRTALAMVFHEVEQPFSARQILWPELQQGELLVEIAYTTICSSDLHTYYGRRGGPRPGILGHEIMGKVVNIAPEGLQDYYGNALQIGDRVTWSVYAHDHGGKMAQKGLPQKSEGLFKYGHEKLDENHELSGGFATHCHLRAGTDVFKLPESLSPKAAAPINCTHATVAGAIRLAGNLEGKNVLIIGAGMLGLSAGAMSKEAGAKSVWTMDTVRDRLERSSAFGADGLLDAHAPVEEIAARMQERGGVDVIIETSGVPSAMETGLDLLNIGGVCVWLGAVYSQRALRVNAEKVVRNILTIKGLHNYTPADLATAVRFVAENHRRYPFEELVGREFPLQELDQAFATANASGYYRIGIYGLVQGLSEQ